MRKVFLNNLPRKIVNRHGSVVDWEKSIGYKVNFVYDDKFGDIEIISYDKNTKNLSLKYNEKCREILVNNFQRASIGRLIGVNDNSFRFDIGHIFNDEKRCFEITDRYYKKWSSRNSNTKVYSCKCHNCEYEWEIDEYHLIEGNGCPVCASKIIIPGVNDLGTIYPFTKKFFPNNEYENYSPHSSKKVEVVCPDCGRKKKIMISNLAKRKSIGCTCQDNFSYPNKFIFAFILQFENLLDSEPIREFNPEWANGRLYDLYFEIDKNAYVIEMDGAFHNKIHSKSNLTLEDIKKIDREKDEMLIKHNIKMIRIDSNESNVNYLKEQITNSCLSDLFNLEDVNWNKCDEYALNNLVKEISKYHAKHDNLSAFDISKIFHISDTTARRYLHIGNEHGWCNYDFTKYQKLKASKINKNNMRKTIVQFDLNMNIIKIWNSMSEASKKLNISLSGISNCCSKKLKTSGSYIWRYADEVNMVA